MATALRQEALPLEATVTMSENAWRQNFLLRSKSKKAQKRRKNKATQPGQTKLKIPSKRKRYKRYRKVFSTVVVVAVAVAVVIVAAALVFKVIIHIQEVLGQFFLITLKGNEIFYSSHQCCCT